MRIFIKYSGMLSLLIGAVTVAWCGFVQSFNFLGMEPISYLGTTSSAGFFKAGVIISATLLLVFYKFISTNYKTSKSYKILFVTSVISIVTLALLPEKIDGNVQVGHWIAAWMFVAALAGSLVVFYVNNKKTPAGRLSKITGLLLLALLIPEAVLYAAGLAAALSQIINMLVYAVWLGCVTYWSTYKV